MVLSAAGFLMSEQKATVIMPASALVLLFANLFFDKKSFAEKIYSRIIILSAITAIASIILLKTSL